MTTHGEQRLGLLTSSKAAIIQRGKGPAWETLRDQLWADDGSAFDNKAVGGAREYGHEHEAEGAAKFWERHPGIDLQPFGSDGKPPFFVYRMPGSPLDGWLASSPDRILLNGLRRDGLTGEVVAGLEIKSPTSLETFAKHTLNKHLDQVQHGLLVTGLPEWWLVVHFEDMYKEWCVMPHIGWQNTYLYRARHFLEFCYEGKELKRRKLSINDLT